MKTILLIAVACSLTSCKAVEFIDGLRQTNPRYNGPLPIMKWWEKQKK